MENINSCNVCDSSKIKTLSNNDNFTYSICKSCGHVFQSNRRSEEFYSSLPYTVAQSKITNVQSLEYDKHVNNRGTYIYDFIKNFIKPYHKSILDIGSGFGGVSYYLGKLMNIKNILGVTPDYDPNVFNKYEGIDFIKSTYNKPINGKYDLIIMSHVLEHFINPIEALKNVKQNISDQGLLYIEVPSFQWEGARHYPIFTQVHLSYFSKKSLENILENVGFKIIKIKESKYWGSIKILAIPINIKKPIIKNKENWRFKIFNWNLKKYFLYYIINLYKKFIHIKPND